MIGGAFFRLPVPFLLTLLLLTYWDARWEIEALFMPTRELLAMAHIASRGSRAPSVVTPMLFLLLPYVASAGWGNENWCERS